jgi:L-threonylcarbamoyladenylate synthase
MRIISNCTDTAIKKAATSLLSGNLVAFPTETVYGLGADATSEDAVAKVYKAKGRPTNHPLIVHISSMNVLDKWASDIPAYAMKLAKSFWPGPMTLILPRTELAKDFITGGQDNVGIRIPSHIVALSLLKEFEAQGGDGVVAPSANRYGAVSPTTSNSVVLELSDFLQIPDQILDGGPCEIGLESTIVDCTDKCPKILRPGAVSKEMIENLLGHSFTLGTYGNSSRSIRVSGSLASHYSPRAKVLLSGTPNEGDGFIALSSIPTPKGVNRLAAPKSNAEYASTLYEALRLADIMGLNRVFVVPPKGGGIAVAIHDRLIKSAFDQ